MRTGLWALFALLLALSGIRLLFGCELTPAGFLGRFCPTPTDFSALARETEQRRHLQERIQEAEIALARVPPCQTCIPAAPRAQQQEFALLLDVTASMTDAALDVNKNKIVLPDGRTPSKIDIVKRDLPGAMEEIGNGVVHFMKFGGCTKPRPVARLNGRTVAQQIRALDNYSVNEVSAPIAAALREIGNIFIAGPDGRYFGNVLIVTDTGKECDDDPCAAARDLAAQKPGIVVNVVDLENSESLRCVPEATGGKFFARGSQVDLRDTIQEAKVFRDPSCPAGPASAPARPRQRG